MKKVILLIIGLSLTAAACNMNCSDGTATCEPTSQPVDVISGPQNRNYIFSALDECASKNKKAQIFKVGGGYQITCF